MPLGEFQEDLRLCEGLPVTSVRGWTSLVAEGRASTIAFSHLQQHSSDLPRRANHLIVFTPSAHQGCRFLGEIRRAQNLICIGEAAALCPDHDPPA
jgi:hypothetical protein